MSVWCTHKLVPGFSTTPLDASTFDTFQFHIFSCELIFSCVSPQKALQILSSPISNFSVDSSYARETLERVKSSEIQSQRNLGKQISRQRILFRHGHGKSHKFCTLFKNHGLIRQLLVCRTHAFGALYSNDK